MAFKYYNYNPSEGAAIPFAALFGLTTVIHIWQAIRTRTWYLIPFIVGAVCRFPCPCNHLRLLTARQSRQSATYAGSSAREKLQTGQ